MNTGSAPWTRADAEKLRAHLAMNCKALLATVPLIVDGVQDDDAAFALREIGYAESQLRGLRQMVQQAKAKRCRMVDDGEGVRT